MAKRDVIKYYTKCVSQYDNMTKTVKDLQKAYEEGKVSQEQAEQFVPMVQAMGENCQRIAYIVYLLNQPVFSFKKAKTALKDGKLLEYFKSIKADKDSISLENEKVLDLLNDTLKKLEEIKNDGK